MDELAAFASEGEDLGAYAAGIDQAVSTAWEYFAGPRPQLTAPALKHARAMTDENEYDRFVRLLPPMLNASQARVFERLDALAAGGAA